MLDAHPDLAIPTETHFLPALIQTLEETQSAQAALDLIAQAPTWPNLGLDLAELATAFKALDPLTPTTAIRALFALYAARQGKPRWGDKTPPYRAYMAEIARALPEARFIHIIRDGRDVALSYRGLWFGPGDDIAAQARFWVEEIERARAQAQAPPFYLEVKYEDLVTRPERELGRICGALDLPYTPALLDYPGRAEHRLSEYVQTFGPQGVGIISHDRFLAIHDRTHTAPDPARIGRWRQEMTSAERHTYELIAGPLLSRLGYETNA
jgi:hypothetical protein